MAVTVSVGGAQPAKHTFEGVRVVFEPAVAETVGEGTLRLSDSHLMWTDCQGTLG